MPGTLDTMKENFNLRIPSNRFLLPVFFIHLPLTRISIPVVDDWSLALQIDHGK